MTAALWDSLVGDGPPRPPPDHDGPPRTLGGGPLLEALELLPPKRPTVCFRDSDKAYSSSFSSVLISFTEARRAFCRFISSWFFKCTSAAFRFRSLSIEKSTASSSSPGGRRFDGVSCGIEEDELRGGAMEHA